MRSKTRVHSRRAVLRMGAIAVVAFPLALPLVTACGPGYEDKPDELAPLAEQARADATAATALASASPEHADLARQIATIRAAHAEAIQSEVDRQNQPRSQVRPAEFPASVDGLKQRLAQSRQQAEDLIPGLPKYRVGLIAKVAGGCAAAQQISDQVGPGNAPDRIDPTTMAVLPPESIDSVQQALAAEHAAVWVYGLVSAFLPAGYAPKAAEGVAEHRDRRDACVRLLTAAGAAPITAEAAYLPPKPVTDGKSAMSVVAFAESDTAAAWRGVIERTEDREVRALALRALLASARRGTRWRFAAGDQPTAIALP